jgi:hypothetical protein
MTLPEGLNNKKIVTVGDLKSIISTLPDDTLVFIRDQKTGFWTSNVNVFLSDNDLHLEDAENGLT